MAFYELSNQYKLQYLEELKSLKKKTKTESMSLKKAKVSHMFSLIIIGLYFPYQCKFMDELIMAF